MGQKRTLTLSQINQIVLQRVAGIEVKVIARSLGCTPHQVVNYWRKSAVYPGKPRKRSKRSWKEVHEVMEKRRSIERTSVAKSQLSAEIAVAKIEMQSAPPYKPSMAAMGMDV